MPIRPGLGRKSSNKNPPIFSHEFVIQNHADIISCIAMVFVVGLMNETTSPIASSFITLHHNASSLSSTSGNEAELAQQQTSGKPITYVAGPKDYCAVFFYTLTCIIMHAIIQEFSLDKISKKLHLSKFKLSMLHESGQLVVFYALSLFWGLHIMLREGYVSDLPRLWHDFPDHPMIFLHKFYFIIQLAYYLHMLPELYFQRIKKEEQHAKIVHSICGFSLICLAYVCGFQRMALVLLTLHYASETVSHAFQLISVFDREERLAKARVANSVVFVFARFATMVIGVLTLYYGLADNAYSTRALFALILLIGLQGYLVYSFISEELRAKREANLVEKTSLASLKERHAGKRKKESDLPEADQQRGSPHKNKHK